MSPVLRIYKTMNTDDKIVVTTLRHTDSFEQNAQNGIINWSAERRSLLQEFDPVNRHTMPMTGGLVG
ncbi:hypothetical protein N9D61_02410 [Planktomarina sp.]|nr:hypothetical protein [Planktomarina sp.]